LGNARNSTRPSQSAGDPGLSPQGSGVQGSHCSESFSACCLMNLDAKAAFCAPKTRINKACLPQTKGAINILCPCQKAWSCFSKDLMCPACAI
ncbi:hypothetical protein MC885_019205, partial [Smutsia gigantea]